MEGCVVERVDRARGRVTLELEEGLAPAENQERGVFMVFTLPQPVAGRQLAGRVTLRSSVSQRVVVKFARQGQGAFVEEIGRAHVGTPVTNAHLVCRHLLEKKNFILDTYYHNH